MPMRCDDYKVNLPPYGEVDIEGERKALRNQVMSLDAQNAESLRQLDQAVTENKKLRKALEYYADLHNWECRQGIGYLSRAQADSGAIARKAMGK